MKLQNGYVKRKIKMHSWRTIKTLFVVLICFFLVFPVLTIISNAFKTQGEILRSIPTLIPRKPTFENFIEVYNDPDFRNGMINSLKLALVNMVLVSGVALPAAYALGRFRSKGANALQVWVLGSQMIPGIILLVPMYNILKTIGLNNTHPGMMIIYLASSLPMALWMLIGFVKSTPEEVEEAAFIDGCNIVQMLVRVLIPMMLPGLLTAMIMTFINTWNEYYFALCMLKDPNLRTLSLKLHTYIGLSGDARKGMLAAGSLIATIPGMLVFTFFTKYYVQGATAGAVKG